MQDNLLAISLAASVPLKILELKAQGGLKEQDIQATPAISRELAEKGDILLFGGGKKGEVAELFNKLVYGIAILAFAPGGISIFGQHFKAEPLTSPKIG